MADVVWEVCNACLGKKRHEVLFKKKDSWSDDIGNGHGVSGVEEYTLLCCCGCNKIKFVHKSWFSEDMPDDEPTIRHYPPLSYRSRPNWINELWPFGDFNRSILDFLNEIYSALQNNASSLAAMGIRALLETIMVKKVGDKGSFKKNVNSFCEEGYISKIQKEIIENILEVGHAAIHRDFKPIKSDVSKLLDVTESILETILIDAKKIKKVVKKVPRRGETKKSKTSP